MLSTDETIIAGARAGDQEAWDVLVDAHVAAVWSVIGRAGLAPVEAEQVCQLTWLRLAQSLADLPPGQSVRDWLTAVARTECRRAVRGRRARAGASAARATGSKSDARSGRLPLQGASSGVAKKLA